MKTFTRIEKCITSIDNYQYAYLRTSHDESARDLCLSMIYNLHIELDLFPKQWVSAVKTIINLR